MTAYAAAHDVETKKGIRLEVKNSKLTDWDKRSGSKKWQWAKLLGESGNKQFDFAILVGDADPRYKKYYKDNISPFIFFCIPFAELHKLTSQGQRTEYRQIYLGSNPLRLVRPESVVLFKEFQRTADELEKLFGI
jgi:hypothetical protein